MPGFHRVHRLIMTCRPLRQSCPQNAPSSIEPIEPFSPYRSSPRLLMCQNVLSFFALGPEAEIDSSLDRPVGTREYNRRNFDT